MENNKLIAEFMGCTHPFNNVTDATLYNVSHGTFELSDLRYDVSWDWLMPVVKKCYQEHKSRHIVYDVYIIAEVVMTCNIDEVYQVVVEFIKDYNHDRQ